MLRAIKRASTSTLHQGSQAPAPRITGTCTKDHKPLHQGSQASAPRITGTCTKDHRHLHQGSQAPAPRITGTCTKDHRHLHQGSQAPAPRITGTCTKDHRHLILGAQASDPRVRWVCAGLLGPLGVEGAWLVEALVGVGAKQIALTLNQAGRQAALPNGVEVRQRAAHR
jgi:hypothetical protein